MCNQRPAVNMWIADILTREREYFRAHITCASSLEWREIFSDLLSFARVVNFGKQY